MGSWTLAGLDAWPVSLFPGLLLATVGQSRWLRCLEGDKIFPLNNQGALNLDSDGLPGPISGDS